MDYNIGISRLGHYSQLYSLMQSQGLRKGDYVSIDLADHLMFKPIHVILLTLGIIQLENMGIEIEVFMPSGNSQMNFLDRIEFEKFVNANIHDSNSIPEIGLNNALPIRRVNTEHLNEYILEALRFFSTQCQGKDTSMLNLSIAELINNVYDHAGDDSDGSPINAYIFSQLSSKKNKVAVVVGDFGLGIPGKANKYFAKERLPIKNSQECIQWALEPNQSTFSKPHNRGKGLNNILSFVRSSNSKLRIFSNDIVFQCKNGIEESYIKNPITDFRGTIVEVEININGLPDDEEFKLDSMWN